MNANEIDFQKKLDEIGELYETGKDAIYSLMADAGKFDIPSPTMAPDDASKAMESIRRLRDNAAMACKAAYKIQEN